MTEAPET